MALPCWAPAHQEPVLPHGRVGGSPDSWSLEFFSRLVEPGEELLAQGTAAVPSLDEITVQRLGFPGLAQLPSELSSRTYGELFVTTRRIIYFSLPFLAEASPGDPALMPFMWEWDEIGAYELAKSPGVPWLATEDQPPLVLSVGFMDSDAPSLAFFVGVTLGTSVASAAAYYVSEDDGDGAV